MRIVTGPRQSGRSTFLLNELAKDKSAVLVVSTYQEVSHLRSLADHLGLGDVDSRILTVTALSQPGFGGKKIIVDELDTLLTTVLGAPVVMASANPILEHRLNVPEPEEPEPEVPDDATSEERLVVVCEDCARKHPVDGPEDVLRRTREHAGHKVIVRKEPVVKTPKKRVSTPNPLSVGNRHPGWKPVDSRSYSLCSKLAVAIRPLSEPDKAALSIVAAGIHQDPSRVTGWHAEDVWDIDALKFQVHIRDADTTYGFVMYGVQLANLPSGVEESLRDLGWNTWVRVSMGGPVSTGSPVYRQPSIPVVSSYMYRELMLDPDKY